MEDSFALELTILIFLLILSRILYVIHKITTGHTKTAQHKRTKPAKTLICIGSGGHTTEMLTLVKTLDVNKYSPRYYVMADNDMTSRSKVEQIEHDSSDYHIMKIPRSRIVNQSYYTSVLTTLWATVYSIPLVCKVTPDVILCNGPGTCIPICLISLVLKVAFVCDTRIVFVESFCRVRTFSLSGKILSYIADNVLVQWPTLKTKLKRSDYIGRLM